MTVREVVLHRDIRTSVDLSPATLLNRHHLRRFLSVFILAASDVVSIVIGGLLAVQLTRVFKPGYGYPAPLVLACVCVIVVTIFLANGLYGRRSMRHSARRLARASLMAIAVVMGVAVVSGLSLDHVTVVLTIVLATALTFAARAAYDGVLARVFGDDGRHPFSCYKFRTMYRNAAAASCRSTT